TVDPDVPRVAQLHAGLLEADAGRVGDRSDGHEAVAALDRAAVRQGRDNRVTLAHDALGTALVHDVHAVAGEDVFDDARGIRVLTRQHHVAARDEGDLGAEGTVGGGELGTRDAGADDDEVLGDGVDRVQLRPGEDAFAVWL